LRLRRPGDDAELIDAIISCDAGFFDLEIG
jgi:hypothetical protein